MAPIARFVDPALNSDATSAEPLAGGGSLSLLSTKLGEGAAGEATSEILVVIFSGVWDGANEALAYFLWADNICSFITHPRSI